MIQAIGLTSMPRRQQQPAVDDLTFEARPGSVTVLLGPEGAGKTSALRLMLQLQSGRGVALFRGRPVHRVRHLPREVGVLLGDVPSHPGRTARGYLRMLTAVAGVPAERADDVLDVVGLSGLADQRLGTFSLGMDRRLGIACALLGDPHTLVLDEPSRGLSPREGRWLRGLVRSYADQGGAVLITSRDTRETAQLADRVVSIGAGRLIADQDALDFARTRLRPRVVVRTPRAERLASALAGEFRRSDRAGQLMGPVQVVHEGGNRVCVYGSNTSEVGEFAYRHSIPVHQLSTENGDMGDAGRSAPLTRVDGRQSREVLVPVPQMEIAPEGSSPVAHAPVTAPPASGAGAPFEPEPNPGVQAAPGGGAVPGETACPGTESVGPVEVAESVTGRDAPADEKVPSGEGARDTAMTSPVADGDVRGAAAECFTGIGTALVPGVNTAAADPSDMEATASAEPTACFEAAADSGEASEAETTLVLQTPVMVHAATAPAFAPVSASLADSLGPAGSESVQQPQPQPESDIEAPAETEPQPGRRSVPSGAPARAHGQPAKLPPRLIAVPRPGPAAPFRYEVRRLLGVSSTWTVAVAAAVTALCVALVLGRTGRGLPLTPDSALSPTLRLLTGWPAGPGFFLPPAAIAAGLLGALAFGHEFRYPALTPARSAVPRRLGLLVAKLTVSTAVSVLLCAVVAAVNSMVLVVCFGWDVLALSAGGGSGTWTVQSFAVLALTTGCSWAGVLAAGIFRSALAGAAMVLAVPLLIAPAVRELLTGPAGHSLTGFPDRLESVLLVPWPPVMRSWLSVAFDLAGQPVGRALALSLGALLCAYVVTVLRSRAR